MARGPGPSAADLVVAALSPALVMGLVGSLVFFLAEVLYAGQYSLRLNWTLFFFVFGTVLIARIGVVLGGGVAAAYGVVLGAVVFAAFLWFVEYPDGIAKAFGWAINLGLMAVIWCSAHVLTRDCTVVEDEDRLSDAGLLETSGLEALDPDLGRAAPAAAPPPPARDDESWWDRLCRHVTAQSKKPRAPGRWIVYFSLAALPLFGLGQALIPPGEPGRRRYAFLLLTLYLASGLGLLLTTSFLNLRRYLRQRRMKMPLSLTAVWLCAGGGLIAALLLGAMVLPRPAAEYVPWLASANSRDHDASRNAGAPGEAGKGSGQGGQDSKKSGERDGQGQGKADKDGKTAGKTGEQKGHGGQGGESKQGGQGDRKGEGQGGREKKSDGENRNAPKGPTTGEPPKADGGSTPAPPPMPDPLGKLGELLKWVVFAVIALAVVGVLIYAGLRWLAPFTEWARNLLAMFGAGPAAAGEDDEDEAVEAELARPFADFSDPFGDGTARRRSPEDLVRYSFAALEAWAVERGEGRREDETPLEFGRRMSALAEDMPGAAELGRLAALAAYAPGPLPASAREAVRQFWREIGAVQAET
jgi:hypothetical protein